MSEEIPFIPKQPQKQNLQIHILFDGTSLQVNAPEDKIVALGMLDFAKHVIMSQPRQASPLVAPPPGFNGKAS